MAISYILEYFPVLAFCTKKNLATLFWTTAQDSASLLFLELRKMPQ
jgi:hypothetical protein